MLSLRSLQCISRRAGVVQQSRSGNRFMSKVPPPGEMTAAERDAAIRHANKEMKSYVETRILAKQGKLPSKRKGQSQKTRSQNQIQLALFLSLSAAFIASPILGRKIAQDEEFRNKYVPAWYDFRVKTPESAWTRQELHEQLVAVEHDMRERVVKGEFTPEKLEEMKGSLQARSDLTEEDLYYAKKYGWGRVHPGVDPDDDDDDY
jgi:hypothetical protein